GSASPSPAPAGRGRSASRAGARARSAWRPPSPPSGRRPSGCPAPRRATTAAPPRSRSDPRRGRRRRARGRGRRCRRSRAAPGSRPSPASRGSGRCRPGRRAAGAAPRRRGARSRRARASRAGRGPAACRPARSGPPSAAGPPPRSTRAGAQRGRRRARAGCGAPARTLPSPSVRVALSIAGSDPTGGAGLQADLQVFRAFGVHGAAVVTALTVQDTAKVHRVLPVFPNVALEQLRVLLADVTPHAVKIGMLATDDVARNVAPGLLELERGPHAPPIVLDPVLRASDGTRLLEPRARGALEDLIGRAALVTPNLPEAHELTGCDVSTEDGVQAAGSALVVSL